MIDLEQSLPILLDHYKTIHIPEFGTFFSFKTPVTLTENTKSFSFSSSNQQIRFKEEVVENDFLINHFSFHLNQPYEKVKEEISKTVFGWKNELKTNKTIKLSFLGDFNLDGPTNELSFIPNNSELFTKNETTFNKIKKFTFKHFLSNFLFYASVVSLLLAISYVLFYNLTPYEIVIPSDFIDETKKAINGLIIKIF